MVYLVGAGPGSPDLITVKGLRLLRKCDAVIYDRLLSDELLNEIPKDCQKIYVGKKPMSHSKKQDEINEILVQTAKQYKNVVRLKGGDPFVFGRGGEEVIALQKARIPFLVVPGVTSAIAVSELAGIPVTHRGESRSFHVFTGHTKEGDVQSFSHITKQEGTSVFLMSVANLAIIIKRLMEQGMDGLTPAAVISHGTMPDEKRIFGTLADIEDKVRKEKVTSPAVFIVGETAKYHFVSQAVGAMTGKKIGIVATHVLQKKMQDALEEKGAISYPLCEMEIVPAEGITKLQEELSRLEKYHWIVFTSQNAIRLFFEEVRKCRMDGRAFAGIRFAVVGTGTKKTLESCGFYADFMPEEYTTTALAAGLSKVVCPGERLLIPRAFQAREELSAVLREKSVEVTEVLFYDVVGKPTKYLEMWKNMDALVFASASGVEAFVSQIEKENREKTAVPVAAIGDVTASRLNKYGICVDVTPKKCDLTHLVAALEHFFDEKGRKI